MGDLAEPSAPLIDRVPEEMTRQDELIDLPPLGGGQVRGQRGQGGIELAGDVIQPDPLLIAAADHKLVILGWPGTRS